MARLVNKNGLQYMDLKGMREGQGLGNGFKKSGEGDLRFNPDILGGAMEFKVYGLSKTEERRRRAEFVLTGQKEMPVGRDSVIEYTFMAGKEWKPDPVGVIPGQLHAVWDAWGGGANPICGLNLTGSKLVFFHRYYRAPKGTKKKVGAKTVTLTNNFKAMVPYHFRLLFNPVYDGSGGRIMVWFNGKLVLDKKGPNTFGNGKGPYWKGMIYKPLWKDLAKVAKSPVKTVTFYMKDFKYGTGPSAVKEIMKGAKLPTGKIPVLPVEKPLKKPVQLPAIPVTKPVRVPTSEEKPTSTQLVFKKLPTVTPVKEQPLPKQDLLVSTKPFQEWLAFAQKWEGGFSDHPKDSGGATNKGVTYTYYKSAYERLSGKKPTWEHFRYNFSNFDQALFFQDIWGLSGANLIKNDAVAMLLADTSLMSGTKIGGKLLQTSLNDFGMGIKEDGVVREITASVANQVDPKDLLKRMIERRNLFYLDLVQRRPKDQVFLKGWLNRLENFVEAHGGSAGLSLGAIGLFVFAGYLLLRN